MTCSKIFEFQMTVNFKNLNKLQTSLCKYKNNAINSHSLEQFYHFSFLYLFFIFQLLQAFKNSFFDALPYLPALPFHFFPIFIVVFFIYILLSFPLLYLPKKICVHKLMQRHENFSMHLRYGILLKCFVYIFCSL